MTTDATPTSRPGINVGTTSEFSLFFRVNPGSENDLRNAVEGLQRSPGYRPGDYNMPIASIHEVGSCCSTTTRDCCLRQVSTDRGHAYMEDFASKPLQLFAAIFQHVEGYDGLPDLAAVKEFILSAQVTAGGYARNYGGTVKEIRKAERVNAAFQQVLDDPDAEETLGHPALKPLLDEAADA